MSLRHQIRFTLSCHLESQRERSAAETAHIGRDLNQIVQHKGFSEIEVDLHARKPNVQTVEDFRVRQAYRSKELGLYYLEEPQELTVVDYPSPIYVGPTDVLFDRELLVRQFVSSYSWPPRLC